MCKKQFLDDLKRYRTYVIKTLNLRTWYLPFCAYFIYHQNNRTKPHPVTYY